MDWTSYHDVDDIEGFIGWLNSTGGDLVQVASAARSEEGREVLVVRVNDPATEAVKKKKIWIEGGEAHVKMERGKDRRQMEEEKDKGGRESTGWEVEGPG